MGLLDKLKVKAIDVINDADRQKEWVEKGYDKLLEEARDLIPAESSDVTISSLRDTALFAVSKLEKHRVVFVQLGDHGLRSTIALLGLGRYDDAAQHAALLTLRTSASWDEATAAIIGAAESGNQAKRELDAQMNELKDTLKDVGVVAAKALLPILLALI